MVWYKTVEFQMIQSVTYASLYSLLHIHNDEGAESISQSIKNITS